MELLQKLLAVLEKNLTKVYLVLTNVALVVFAIIFTNVGLLPFKSLGDFAFFAILVLVLAFYRPSWTFAFFVGVLALENVNLAPASLGLAVRPYQLLAAATLGTVFVQIWLGRSRFVLPRFTWRDWLVVAFVFAGFVSSIFALQKGAAFKQAAVAFSFAMIYLLVRIFIQSWEDLKKIAPFFLSSGVVVALYAIWQNVRFARGVAAFEVMPGRPNATFAEPDWLGIYLVFLLAVVLTVFYRYCTITKKQEIITKQITNSNNQNNKQFGNLKLGCWLLFGVCFLYLVILFVALILTVSRSAWVGVVLVLLGFLKMTLLQKGWQPSAWQGKEFGRALVGILIMFAVSVGVVYVFGLTRFQLGSRASSTSGLQKITIACESRSEFDSEAESNSVISAGSMIASVDELAKFGCRHINLEDIAKEKAAGNVIMEVQRPDPNVNVRVEIYRKSWGQIKAHPLVGIGWGNISPVLGKDERGAGLNASNIFLETWLGAGFMGLVALVVLLGYILFSGIAKFWQTQSQENFVFILLGLAAIVIPNLFNSGIFLGFAWVYLAVAVGMLTEKNN